MKNIRILIVLGPPSKNMNYRLKDVVNIGDILNYDEKKKSYTIDIPENVSSIEIPFMMSLFLKKGIHRIDSDWSMRWVRSRIIPSSRQNIGEILQVNGMDSYDEQKLLLKNEGRSCQDEFYIAHL